MKHDETIRGLPVVFNMKHDETVRGLPIFSPVQATSRSVSQHHGDLHPTRWRSGGFWPEPSKQLWEGGALSSWGMNIKHELQTAWLGYSSTNVNTCSPIKETLVAQCEVFSSLPIKYFLDLCGMDKTCGSFSTLQGLWRWYSLGFTQLHLGRKLIRDGANASKTSQKGLRRKQPQTENQSRIALFNIIRELYGRNHHFWCFTRPCASQLFPKPSLCATGQMPNKGLPLCVPTKWS